MLKIRGKKFILFAIITLIVMGFLLSSLFILEKLNKNVKDKNLQTTAADLYISTYNNLRDFAASVNNGNTYEGKTVELKADIDCGGSSLSCIGSGSWNSFSGGTINSFKGTFDGKGHAIKNFTLTGGARFQTRTIKGQKAYNYKYYYHMALFVEIGSSALITNLKISDYNLGTTSHVSTPTTGAHSYYHYDRQEPLVSNYHTAGSISKCWINGAGLYMNLSSVTDIMLSNSIINGSGGEITTKDTTTGLDCSSSGSSSSIWYYAAEYNSGWPKLRVFINWKTVEFSGTGVTFSPTSIQIPTEANETFNGSGNAITIYGQVVTANSSLCHYSSSSWTANSATSYTATFTAVNRTVTINVYNEYTNETTTWKTLTIGCGNKVSISEDVYSGSGCKNCTIGGNKYTPPDDSYYIVKPTDGNEHSDRTITITIRKKNYQIGFK